MTTTRRPALEIQNAIVDAAVRVVADHGVDGLTHRAVAQRAGVSLSSTTYHFASKEAIVAAALQRVVDLDLERLDRASEKVANLKGERGLSADDLVDVLLGEAAKTDSVRIRAQYHLQLEAAERPDLRPIVEAWSDAITERVAAAVANFGSAQPRLDAQLILAATDGLRIHALATSPATVSVVVRPVLVHLLALLKLPAPNA
ncbi:MAG: TetR family transcriptional regulator [Propionibacteriaceae bacterium]|jgi:DNA-binding transcriptional regulator YbjK|nr:TetR family transcriptional regulator [Micropruina sp.]